MLRIYQNRDGVRLEAFVVTMQDVLELSGDSRMNTPGIPMGNWTWRMLPGAADDKISARLRSMTRTYKRL